MCMAHYGTLREFEFPGEVDDIRGSTVYDLEGQKIGKIDDVVLDHSTAQIKYAVVDSGGWLSSHKFLVPADRIKPCGEDEDEFTVGVTKQQSQNLPPYDEKRLEREEDWKRYEEDYKRNWHAGPVQHRHGSDRNITPEPEEMPVSAEADREASEIERTADVTPARLEGKFPPAEEGGGKIRLEPTESARVENAAYGTAPLSGRWDRFQETVKENRKDILSQCPSCCDTAPGNREVA
jgi:sporulation protein YlmC with PRC-barrel domain